MVCRASAACSWEPSACKASPSLWFGTGPSLLSSSLPQRQWRLWIQCYSSSWPLLGVRVWTERGGKEGYSLLEHGERRLGARGGAATGIGKPASGGADRRGGAVAAGGSIWTRKERGRERRGFRRGLQWDVGGYGWAHMSARQASTGRETYFSLIASRMTSSPQRVPLGRPSRTAFLVFLPVFSLLLWLFCVSSSVLFFYFSSVFFVFFLFLQRMSSFSTHIVHFFYIYVIILWYKLNNFF